MARARAVDRIHLRRLFHADPRHSACELLAVALGPWEAFWMLFYGLATYGNAGYMREQVCKYMCPYARFQSAMFDRDTLIVSYDSARGEPRGARARGVDPGAIGKGECIDCTLCVQVCPTGIDISKGLQYECIGCAACVDVCNGVMDKMGYPRGLIRFATQNALETKAARVRCGSASRARASSSTPSRWSPSSAWRPRRWPCATRSVDVIRDRGALAREVAPGAWRTSIASRS